MGIEKTSLLVLKLHLDSLEGYPIVQKLFLMCSLGNSYSLKIILGYVQNYFHFEDLFSMCFMYF